MRTGARFYFAASIVAQASALVRYVILARILGPEELGLAAMLVLTAQFFESVSDTGADRFIVQNPDGDTPRMLGLVHMAMAVRGVVIAGALIVTAGLVARLYSAPQIIPALQVLALVPLVAGFTNLDMRRAQRTGDFRPESYVTMFGELAGVAASAVAAFIVRDHTAVLYGLIARAIIMVGASHVVSQRRYGWAYGRSEAHHFFQFAGPLAINGLFLYFGSQGDRLLVASGLGAAALGQYSAILLLIFNPTSAVTRFLQGMHLPQVAASRDDPIALRRQGERLAAQTLLLSVGAAVGFAAVGPWIAPILYGNLGVQPLLIFAGLGVVQAARMLRGWPTTLALGLGRSSEVMINNIVRVVALPLALLASLQWHSLPAILLGFFTGEVLALLGALWFRVRASSAPAGSSVRRTSMFLLLALTTVITAAAGQYHQQLLLGASVSATIILLAILLRQERPTVQEAFAVVSARLRPRGRRQ